MNFKFVVSLTKVSLNERLFQFHLNPLFSCKGLDCDCIKDCPISFRNEPSHEKLPHDYEAKQFYNSQSWTNSDCCKIKCRESCLTSFNEIVPNGRSWMNPEDPCTTSICNNGIISNHTSVCSGLPCSSEHHVYRDDTCCPLCDADWASFCPEVYDCDIACRFGFEQDSERSCDVCKCARFESTTSSTSTSVAYDSTLIDDEGQTTRTVKFYLYFDPTDGATKNLLIGITITCFALFVICLAAIGWYFHRKVYRKIPLLSLGNSSA